jgi:hypothetical protein
MMSNSSIAVSTSRGVGWRFAQLEFTRPQFKLFDAASLSKITAFRFLERTTSFSEGAKAGFYTLVQRKVHFFITSDMVCFDRRPNILFENFFRKKSTGIFSVDLREWFNLFYNTSTAAQFDAQTYLPLQASPFYQSKPKGFRSTFNDMAATTFAIGNAFSGA